MLVKVVEGGNAVTEKVPTKKNKIMSRRILGGNIKTRVRTQYFHSFWSSAGKGGLRKTNTNQNGAFGGGGKNHFGNWGGPNPLQNSAQKHIEKLFRKHERGENSSRRRGNHLVSK